MLLRRSFQLLLSGMLCALASTTSAQEQPHSADYLEPKGIISLTELLRVIQFYNLGIYSCDGAGEDGFQPGGDGCTGPYHDADYAPADGRISLFEALRLIQFYNAGGYSRVCIESEDGFTPIPGTLELCPAEGASEGSIDGVNEGIEEGTQEGAGEGIAEGEGEGSLEGVQEGVLEGIQDGALEGVFEGTGEGLIEGSPEGGSEGTLEGNPEGVVEGVSEGAAEGSVEGSVEGLTDGEGLSEGEGIVEGVNEGTVEGASEGTLEGEGVVEGQAEGVLEGSTEGVNEGAVEGIIEGVLEGSLEGVVEGVVEGVFEGVVEGVVEGEPEGVLEGSIEGTLEGEGALEGEGQLEPEPGPFAVASKRITFTDASRSNRSIPATIYYPGTSAGTDKPIAGNEANRFPVLVFAHGFSIGIGFYNYIWDGLVPAGYIVVMCDTENGSIFPPPDHGAFGRDLAFLVDAMQVEGGNPASFFHARVASRSAVAGHSMGGGATMLSVQHSQNIDTIVPIAAADTNPSAIAAAPGISIPALVIGGSKDCVAAPASNVRPMYDGLASACRHYALIDDGSHCQFAVDSTVCNLGQIICAGQTFVSATVQRSATLTLLRNWLDLQLKEVGSPGDFAATLAAEDAANRVTYESDCL